MRFTTPLSKPAPLLLLGCLQLLRVRIGLHKFAKEGLLCLLESCTQEEYRQVGGPQGGTGGRGGGGTRIALLG